VRILVTGGTGLLGWWASKVLSERGYEVIATFNRQKPPSLEGVSWVKMSLEEPRGVNEVFDEVKPDAVIHSAAFTDVDGCELNRDAAYKVNYLGARAVAEASASRGIFLVYISTDYVFDGEKGMYSEDDIPAPINYYGLSKLLGEAAVDALMKGKSSIVRVSGLYGYSPSGKKNFGIRALESLMEGREVQAFSDQYLSPTYAPELANLLSVLIGEKIAGILHIAGERLSRYQFALLLAKKLGAKEDLVKPSSLERAGLKAKRPRDSSLDSSKAKSLGLSLPRTERSIEDFIRTYEDLKKMYG